MRTIRTPRNAERFIDALTEGDSPTAAGRRLGLSRAALYAWRAADPEFAAAWEDAVEAGLATLEAECIRRALNGSDQLLMFILRARRPEVYGQTRVIVLNGKGNEAAHSMSDVEMRRRLGELRRQQEQPEQTSEVAAAWRRADRQTEKDVVTAA